MLSGKSSQRRKGQKGTEDDAAGNEGPLGSVGIDRARGRVWSLNEDIWAA
jgi:hypothetical protein